MAYHELPDDLIVEGFRRGDADIIREYFYGYCKVGYQHFDLQYQLSSKENLDFMSLAHQYALYLMEHDWRPLEDHSPEVSLKTWLIGGFHFVVLDALKWYKKEYGTLSHQEYLLSFDMADSLRLQFNRMVQDLCEHLDLSPQDRAILDLMLLQGYKGKEVGEKLGITPAAVSQRYKRLKEDIITPYFKAHFDIDPDLQLVSMSGTMENACMDWEGYSPMEAPMSRPYGGFVKQIQPTPMEQKRTTPEYITSLQPKEIFVFGSNLRGMHGGGAALVAYRKFGAVMGQGVGLQGQSYAIPTMQGGVETIRPYVDDFIFFAGQHPDLTFLVTRIGCGIAGFRDEEIAPLFAAAHDLQNVVLPPGW